MNIKILQKTIIAGFAIIIMSASTQTFAQETVLVNKTHSPGGNCAIAGGRDASPYAYADRNGTIWGGLGVRTYVSCDLGINPSESAGLIKVEVNLRDVPAAPKYGKSMCSVLYSDDFYGFRGSIYAHSEEGFNTLSLVHPVWMTNYARATLICRINPYDRFYSFTTSSYQ